MEIRESGVIFGEFDADDCFHIEMSDVYEKQLRQYGIKVTEFVLLRNNKLFLVEAKTSTPNPSSTDLTKNCQTCDNKTTGWKKFQDDLLKKYNDTLSMQVLLYLNRLRNSSIPNNFSFDWRNVEICLMLVITSEEKHYKNVETIGKLQELLRIKMKPLLNLWKAELLVLNKDMAVKRKFIKI